jgi:ABC-type uncharacterized transport system permease subunit
MWISFIALTSIVPAMLQAFRDRARRDAVFWITLAVGVLGPVAWLTVHNALSWQTSFAAILWANIAVSLALFGIVSAVFAQAWRLGSLLAGYLMLLGIGAVIWQGAPGEPLQALPSERAWVIAHITFGVITYGLVTIASIAAFAASQQERTLKRKQPLPLVRHLPSLAHCERLQLRLLQSGWGVLSVGVITGMALQWQETRQLLLFSHKVVLTLAAFLVISALLAAQQWGGIRGRRAGRMMLLGYLLLTLGYPGVKFVSEVLMG